jgi:Domain of Unknown Function (DUF930)
MFDEAIRPNWAPETTWSLAASVLLHALLAAAIVQWWTAAPPPPIEENIPVNLLTPDEFEALTRPADQPARLEPPAPTVPDTSQALTHAATILSGRALAEPRNRKARDALPHLNPTERMVQLCNIEALEQVARVRRDFSPETISAYATKDLAIGPDTVEADGAAIRSGDDWYSLRYRCRLSAGHNEVVACDFLSGDQLTAARVEELGLPIGQ